MSVAPWAAGFVGTGLALLIFLLSLVVLAGVKLYRKRQQRYDQPVEHIRKAEPATWQARHREALDRPRRIPARHQADPSAPTARQSRARMAKRTPGK